MLRLVIEKELRDIIGSTKFAVTFAVCALLLLLSFYVGARNYQVAQREYEAAVAESIRQMDGLTDWNRARPSLFLPPRPLAALVTGISNDIGRSVEVQTTGEMTTENSRYSVDPIYAVFRFLDLEFIFTIVLSLFAILFAYDTINGEKERGTLRLSFANPIPRDKYIFGKLIGSYLALTVPLLIPILIGAALLPIFGVPMTSAEWIRLGLVVTCGYIYLGVFLSLSVFISALTEHSSSSFLLLLVVWIFAALIIPRTAVLVSGKAVEVPSIDAINFDKNRYASQLWEEDRPKMRRWWDENSEREGETQAERRNRFRQFMSEMGDARQEKLRVYGAKVNEERRNAELQQQRLALSIARISPSSVFSLASSELAGTSLGLKNRYEEATRQYQESYAQFVKDKTGGTTSAWWAAGNSEEEDQPPIDPYEAPAFSFEDPGPGAVIRGTTIDFGILALFNLVFFAGAFVAFNRYDVR